MAKIDFILRAMSDDDKEKFKTLSRNILHKLKEAKSEIEKQIDDKRNEILELKEKLTMLDDKIDEWEKIANNELE